MSLHLSLPEPQRGSLPRSPLQLVACQLRYADLRNSVTAGRSAAIVADLTAKGYEYPQVELAQSTSLTISMMPGSAQSTTEPSLAYKLLSADARWTLTLGPDAVSLETTNYGRWEDDFRERFRAIVSVVAKVLEPSVTVRLGLRYVDVFEEPRVEKMPDWRGRIRDTFLGPLTDDAFATVIRSVQQQMTLDVANEIRATLRHGAFTDQADAPAVRYLLDTDVYRDRFIPFDTKDISAILDPLHDISSRLFQNVITPEYYEYLSKP